MTKLTLALLLATAIAVWWTSWLPAALAQPAFPPPGLPPNHPLVASLNFTSGLPTEYIVSYRWYEKCPTTDNIYAKQRECFTYTVRTHVEQPPFSTDPIVRLDRAIGANADQCIGAAELMRLNELWNQVHEFYGQCADGVVYDSGTPDQPDGEGR